MLEPVKNCAGITAGGAGIGACAAFGVIGVVAVGASVSVAKRSMIPWFSKCLEGLDQLSLSAYKFMSMQYSIKLESAESKIMKLTTELEQRTNKLQTLATTINTLKEATEENERQMEMQQNELKQQRTALRELCTALGALEFCDSSLTTGATAGENSQAFWVLRKHQRNLVIITRPYRQQMIKAAVEEGLVSENIGKCALKCSIPNHDCVDEFYKALLVRVGESPEALEAFLYLMQQKLKKSRPCCQLFNKMLDEI